MSTDLISFSHNMMRVVRINCESSLSGQAALLGTMAIGWIARVYCGVTNADMFVQTEQISVRITDIA